MTVTATSFVKVMAVSTIGVIACTFALLQKFQIVHWSYCPTTNVIQDATTSIYSPLYLTMTHSQSHDACNHRDMNRYCYNYEADSDRFGKPTSGADMGYCPYNGTLGDLGALNCSGSDNPYLDPNIDLETYPDYPVCQSSWIGTC